MAPTSPIMNIMMKAAEKAGRSLIRDFGEVEQLQVSRKGPGDFVTAADKRAEEIIFEELKAARPSYSFLMEEGGVVEGTDTDNKWIIDPLDGTHNFMHGIPHWCISIALETNGRIEAALVFDPVKHEMFRAERSNGAYLGRNRLRVSNRQDMEMSTIAFGGAQLDPVKQAVYIKELNAVSSLAPMARRFGAAALDLCYVAAGRFDGYWERGIHPWDVAAGILILKESGGFVTTIDNQDNPVYSRNIVSGNNDIHDKVKKILKETAK